MFLLRLLSKLPFPILYAFSDFLFVMSYYVVAYRIKIVRQNLRNSFPEKADQELKKIEKQFYRNLCDYGVETLKLLTISQEELQRRMVFKNAEIIKPYADSNLSVIFLTAHQFNWEWLLAAGCLYLPVGVDFVYQRQSSKFFNEFSLQGRTRFGAYAIERSKVGREAIRRKNILRGIAIMADQFPGKGHDKKVWTNFLNQPTAFFHGVGQLASVTQYPAFFFETTKVKRGHYETVGMLVSSPPYDEDSKKIVEDYAGAIEKAINRHPAGWLWSHNRWK